MYDHRGTQAESSAFNLYEPWSVSLVNTDRTWVLGVNRTMPELLYWNPMSMLNTARPSLMLMTARMGGCHNYGPLLGPLNTRCRIILRTHKRTLILTTTHMAWGPGGLPWQLCQNSKASSCDRAFLESQRLRIMGYFKPQWSTLGYSGLFFPATWLSRLSFWLGKASRCSAILPTLDQWSGPK